MTRAAANKARIGATHPSRRVHSQDDPRIDLMLDTLRQRRINLKRSQKQVAEDTGCSTRVINYMENHSIVPNLSLFIRYASALGYNLLLVEDLK